MKPEDSRLVLSVYERALDLEGIERVAFIERECDAQPTLKRMVESMLGSEIAPGFLEVSTDESGLPRDPLSSSRRNPMIGKEVGSFRILNVVGAGGMGIVYEAEQEYPKRRVALKMLRPEFLQGSSDRRFRSEVELLARLDHPGVARVFEAGLHKDPNGSEQPYFAMEFVEDAEDLSTWAAGRPLVERMKLFVDVCEAVQHGHQRGVVHRDLKPQNVLVDGRGQVKVIDFGIARAVESESGPETRATRVGELVGTLSHMAPEQFELDGREVDTRTDVYALGVLLYDLVTGRLPYDFTNKPVTEIARIIREEPPIPPRKLDGNLPRELGWIALMALQKEPELRYASVSELASDLRRFLTNRPVEAGPPSRLLRARKFLRRNRLLVSAASMVVLASAIGGGVSFAAMLRAETENEKFRGINEVLTDMFVAVRADEEGPTVRAADLLERAATGLARFEGTPEVEVALRRTLAKSFFNLGIPDKAAQEAQRALDLKRHLGPREELDTAYHLGESLRLLDRDGEARELVNAYLPKEAHLSGSEAANALLPLRHLDAKLLEREGDWDEALVRLNQLVADSRKWLGEDAIMTLHFEMTLVDLLLLGKRPTEAEELTRTLLAKRERLDGPMAPDTLVVRSKWARSLSRLGKLEEAIRQQTALVRDQMQVFGESHPFTLVAMGDLANSYILASEHARAIPILEEIIRIRTQREGAQHSATLIAKSSLAVALAALGDSRALDVREEGFRVRRQTLGDDHPETLRAQLALSRYLRQSGQRAEARELLIDLHERSERTLSEDNLARYEAAAELGMALLYLQEVARGADLLERAWRGYQRHAEPQEPNTLAHGSNHAYALMRLARWDAAVPVLTEVLAGMREHLEPDDPRQLATMSNLAIACARRGEPIQAETRLREALAWSEQHLEPRDARRIRMHKNLGEHLLQVNRHREAIEVFEDALVAADLNPDWSPEDQATLHLGYSRSLRGVGRLSDAADELEVVLEMERTRLGLEDPAIQALAVELEATRRGP